MKIKKLLLLFAFTTLLMTSSCNNDYDDQIFCTLEVVAGLNITVLNSQTNQPLIDGVTVQATDGLYQEFLTVGGANSFFGAQERPGTYIITVTKEGYQTFTSSPIVVTADVCHVIPQSLTVNLQSN